MMRAMLGFTLVETTLAREQSNGYRRMTGDSSLSACNVSMTSTEDIIGQGTSFKTAHWLGVD